MLTLTKPRPKKRMGKPMRTDNIVTYAEWIANAVELNKGRVDVNVDLLQISEYPQIKYKMSCKTRCQVVIDETNYRSLEYCDAEYRNHDADGGEEFVRETEISDFKGELTKAILKQNKKLQIQCLEKIVTISL
jgi:hypothetical protein